ncbi:SseB family protein [Flavimaricola marinus]|uniref:SseB protein N-terminal domain-containing protein n=1 Tax=Flavimaricola marinus TaxID=1819565 RepID=A0A238LGK3_9RHOB|nr:SseB family protein [Flavimaricola marinus]SMY08819.1 hypothetical protein LOM8899_02977 [Flavimaricola marinus]
MDDTDLDRAHAAMMAAPENDAARVAFYDCFADAQIVLLLAEEAAAETVRPAVVELGGDRYTVVFDTEERLAAFSGAVAPYAGLSGRGLAEMLAGQKIGIALNPEVAPSTMLIPAEAVDWLAQTLAHAPTEATARPVEILPPGALPEALTGALTRKLRGAGALASSAFLAGVRYADGSRGHLLAFIDAAPDAQPGLAIAANEALTFSGLEAGAMDVTFVESGSTMATRLARVGLDVALPRPAVPEGPAAPGRDPDRPPKLT